MISLRSYEFIEDAWAGGVAEWCRTASSHVLSGGQAWLVTASDGQANWVKRRLLQQGISLFGLQFLSASSLRAACCLRQGIGSAELNKSLLAFTLRLRATELAAEQPQLAPVARHAGSCLAALADFAAAGWLDDEPDFRRAILPASLDPWLDDLCHGNDWPPEIHRRLRAPALASRANVPPLNVCVFGWDASYWPMFDLLAAAVQEASDAVLFAPFPRGSSFDIQTEWQTALEESFAGSFEPCDSTGYTPGHAAMLARLDGTDLPANQPDISEPELLVGLTLQDTALQVRDFVSRCLTRDPANVETAIGAPADCIVILSPRRDLAAIAVLRCLAAAGIRVADELGEVPEPSLAVQIQRAILAYQQEKGDVEGLIAIVELLNEHVAIWDGHGASVLRQVFPLDPLEARRLLQSAFADVQHHSCRVLRDSLLHARSAAARPLRLLVEHLDAWPDHIAWAEALDRWERCLDGLGLSVNLLEPLWSQLRKLPPQDSLPSGAFFQFLSGLIGCVPARRSPDGMHRYARVVMTTLEGARGQTWQAAIFLDSNEGAWPLYPDENGFLDDNARQRLNQRREQDKEDAPARWRGYLLTSSDQAQLEHFRFMELLGNCLGPVAFVGQARDAVDPGQERYANEWALRCLLESGEPWGGEKLLDRWRHAIRRARPTPPALPKPEREHLRAVFAARRDPETAFGEYGFNFESLTSPDELPWTDAWAVRDLELAWNQPATFALKQIFGVSPSVTTGREWMRGEGWMVGRMVHRWLAAALQAGDEPRQMTARQWHQARTEGIASARHEAERALRAALTTGKEQSLPLWWRGTLQRAEWATRRCLDKLAETAADGAWLSLGKKFHADVATATGLLRLQARCDVLLADRPALAGASCQLIDVRTGAVPAVGANPAAQLERGHGLNLAALMFLAVKDGARMESTQIGVIHPDAVNLSLWTAESQPAAAPAMERLADKQRSLKFGQRGGGRDGETLPLATSPIDGSVLASKLAR